jgi:polyisoprenoid-binding protein YceI
MSTTGKTTGTSTWVVDPVHSAGEFAVRHLMVATVRGTFRITTGKIVINEENHTASSVTATIDATSINTREERRDAHLRSADFFDAGKWPTITFRSQSVERVKDTKWKVYGLLKIRDIENAIELDVEEGGEIRDPYGKQRRGFTAETTIDRREWGLNWNQALETGGVMVSDRVKITLDIAAVRED